MDNAFGPKLKKPVPIFIKSLKRDAKSKGVWHQHQRGQLFIIEKGLLAFETASTRTLMPFNHLGWVPPLTKHCAKYLGSIKGQCFYLSPSICEVLPKKPCVFISNPLLKEIIARIGTWQLPWRESHQHLLQVLLDELSEIKLQPLEVVIPEDKRLQKIAHAYILDPTQERTLDEWAKLAHMSKRTLTRHFREQTGISFAKWRQQVCVQKAVELLAKGKSVTSISLSLGYSNVSSFIKIFQKILGKTPKAYL